jgi:hypothetical protein
VVKRCHTKIIDRHGSLKAALARRKGEPASYLTPDFPLDPSSSRRRGSSKKNTPRSGQNLDFDLLCRKYLINWIPACAGMTKFRAHGKSRLKIKTLLFIVFSQI